MKLSIVLATTHPWPAAEACLRILVPQAGEAGAEVVLADSTGEGLPREAPEGLGEVRHLVCAGASVFALRAAGTNAASGEIIAWTEDHCRPAADWCRCLLAAHERMADALAIGGCVLNASTTSALEWANFLNTFATFLPPLHPSRNRRAAVAANLSFKRAALPSRPLEAGEFEFGINPGLPLGNRTAFDSAMVVRHVQSYGWPATPVSHFHNGRSTTGMWARSLSPVIRVGKMGACLVLPAVLLATSVRASFGKGVPYLRALPLMAVLVVAHSAGLLTGLVTGTAGRSPVELE